MTAWRYVESDGAGAADGLAFDEAMMRRYGRGQSAVEEATLRLYTYRPHCALVGRYQNLAAEIDLEACLRLGVAVGRRPTGGGAIIMGPDQLGVAIATRAEPSEAPRESLVRFARTVAAGLEGLGISAGFRSKNDLEVGGRKIAGLGLYLDPRGAVLFHSSVLVDLDVELMLRVLRIPGAKLLDKAVARVADRVTTVTREVGRGLKAAELRPRFAAAMAAAAGVHLEGGGLDGAERAEMKRLLAERYGNRRWVHQRSARPDARGTSVLKTPRGLLRIFVALDGEVIKSVLITGDFNVLPPGLPRLEASLRWCRAEPERIGRAAEEALAGGELGVAPQRIGEAVWEAAAGALRLQRAGHPMRLEGSCYAPGVEEETR